MPSKNDTAMIYLKMELQKRWEPRKCLYSSWDVVRKYGRTEGRTEEGEQLHGQMSTKKEVDKFIWLFYNYSKGVLMSLKNL